MYVLTEGRIDLDWNFSDVVSFSGNVAMLRD